MSDIQFTKLVTIEDNADVTDTANVTSAGAVMDSEVADLECTKQVLVSTLQTKPSEGAFEDGDKLKLDGIEDGANVNVATNLSKEVDGSSYIITSSTGNNVELTLATSDNWGLMSDIQFTKLLSLIHISEPTRR